MNEEPKDELTEADYEYYDRKRKILVEKMAMANDVYLAHLQNYDQKDPKDKSQKFLFQYNEVGNKLNRQFDVVAERLRLPLEQPLMTYCYIVEFWFLTANSLNVHSLLYYNYSYCKFIDILFKRLNFLFIEFSLYIGFIVLENRS